MKKSVKFILALTMLNSMVLAGSLAKRHWAPIIMGDITTFVPYVTSDAGSDEVVNKVYVPNLKFHMNDVYGNGKIIHVGSVPELENAIQEAEPYTTILLQNGTYDNVNILFPKGTHHLTIKGSGEQTVIIPAGRDDNSAFLLPNVASKSEQVHDINFVDFTVSGEGKQCIKSSGGRWVDKNGVVHDHGEENEKYGPYNIYFYKMNFVDLFMGLYSHLYAHDWTVDSCSFTHSSYSHFWYMMGWHLAVINSTLVDPTHDGLAIRGYYPEGEVHTYISDEMPRTEECYGNRYVLDRGSRSVANGFLPADDWTHIIVNNTFKGSSSDRGDGSQPFMVFAYGIYGNDQPCDAEQTYLPPQNVVISGNELDTHGGDNVTTHGIQFDAWQGVNNESLASINGITITDNNFIRKDSEEQFIIIGDSGNRATQEEIDRSHIQNNTIQ